MVEFQRRAHLEQVGRKEKDGTWLEQAFFDAEMASEKNTRLALSLENPVILTKGLCCLHSGFLPGFLFSRAGRKKISQE